ncbi:MAG TPA: hypothetical protein PLB32_04265 [Acidobacteriota bacterium]|nr:hypothetical protein [Acidobacteriota bacterium]
MKRTYGNLLFFWSILLLIAGWSVPVQAENQFWIIGPAITDPAINTATESHYLYLSRSVQHRNQLFLFFPGTGAIPRNYLKICNTAADMGYHVINLRYPNAEAVNQLCGTRADLDCYEQVRAEVIDGTDRSPLVQVNRANSIENRLIKLLQYMERTYPGDGWGQYLDADGQPRWDLIVTSGHSQGGGHAALLAKYHRVARVVMFAAMDLNFLLGKPANWIGTNNATPTSEYYAFSHERDELVSFSILSNSIYPAYGMTAFGPVTSVEATPLPFENTHLLSSNRTVPNNPSINEYHSVIVFDPVVPTVDGRPAYESVWKYLLETDITPPPPPTDTTAPTVQVFSPSSGQIIESTPNAQIFVTWNASDNVGVTRQSIVFRGQKSGVNFEDTIATGLTGDLRSFSIAVQPNDTVSGAQITVNAEDQAGNQGQGKSGLFAITPPPDTQPPQVSAVTLSKTKVKRKKDPGLGVSWTSMDNREVINHTVNLLPAAQSAPVQLITGLAGNIQAFSVTIPGGVAKTKQAVIQVVATDAAGNQGQGVSNQFVIK